MQMEVYPECVDAMMAGLTGEEELLRSVAQRVEQIEGRGEHKVSSLTENVRVRPHPLTGSFTH